MKKIIDIPDEIVKDLKILAIQNDSDLKNYIQNLLSRHNEFSNITEMAAYGIADGQSERFVWNYLRETYKGIKCEKFDHGEEQFDSFLDFLQHVKETCEFAIHHIKTLIDEDEYCEDEL